MKRREFLQQASLGASGLLVAPNVIGSADLSEVTPDIPVLRDIKKLDDIVTSGGEIMLRVEFRNTEDEDRTSYDTRFIAKHGKISAVKGYFLEAGDELDENKMRYKGVAGITNPDIFIVWLSDYSPATMLILDDRKGKHTLTLSELLDKKEITFNDAHASISVNYLLDKEIGLIDPTTVGIKDPGEQFRFAVMADPQGGDPSDGDKLMTRMKIHNAWSVESVRVTNDLNPGALFTLMVGDIIDGQGKEVDFRMMEKFFQDLKTPILYEIGNHESKYSAKFGPGYNHEPLRNYYEAQKRVNGMDKLLYSFNMGEWHFIVWPDPLRGGFWERHPHYFHWLEQDLEQHKDRPTMVFQHVPAHPIGIDPLTEYAEAPYVKRTVLDTLAKFGNVRYVLSGHVHIPLRSSIKTAVEYKGMKLINLPAAGYRPRAFGEQDLYGGPTEGVAIVDIDGKEGKVSFKNVTNEVYTYADKLPTFSSEEYPFWLRYRWEVPVNDKLMNGDFSDGLNQWAKRFIYIEDENPSNIREVRKQPGNPSKPGLYLFNRMRGFNTPGQDRLPQTLNRLAQAVSVEPGTSPILSLGFMIDKLNYLPDKLNGSYIWLEGYEKDTKRMNISYSVGYYFYNIEGNYSQLKNVPSARMEITSDPGIWHQLKLNPYKDFRENTEIKRIRLDKIDRFIINFGVWTINDGYNQKAGAWFRNVNLDFVMNPSETVSLIDDKPVPVKDIKYMYWKGVDHVAGEHQSVIADMNWYGKDGKAELFR
ncbi:MAG TPA: metallophosphoesterase [Bacteroidales bacterium]|nr:metallophosphoesterase [Bacteroidales bacterium]